MGACLSSASCDGQDGRLFSCEKAPSAVDGAFVYERTMKMGMCMEEHIAAMYGVHTRVTVEDGAKHVRLLKDG